MQDAQNAMLTKALFPTACLSTQQFIVRIHIHVMCHLHPALARRLSLHLKLEVKVRRVKVVYTDVTVLTTTAVALARRIDSDVVERTEVTTHTTDLLLEDLVVEDRKSTRLNSSHSGESRMPSSA